MLEVIILRGVPACGKSTFARAFVKQNRDFVIVSRDGIREMIGDYSHSPQTEGLVTKLYDKMVKDLLSMKKSLILDNCHAQPKYISETLKLIESTRLNVMVTLKEFPYDLETCVERDEKRERTVGREVIEKMDRAIRQNSFKNVDKLVNEWKAQRAMNPDTKRAWSDPTISYVKGLPYAILCDIDGTLAHMKDRSPFDWKRVGEDVLDITVRDILGAYHCNDLTDDVKIILLSGRDAVCRKETEDWCVANSVPYDRLLMRPENDQRKDSIVKREIYENEIKGKYNVLFVLDDRNQVVEMWRDLGLKCLQVEYGDF